MLNSCFDKDLRQDFNESNFITEVEGKEILLKTSYNSDRNLLGLVVAAPSPGSIPNTSWGASWSRVQCSCHMDPVRPNSNLHGSAHQWCLNYSCYVELGLNWPI